MTVELEVACRSCEACLRARARLWSARAVAETRVWPRTWFGTMTLRPEEVFRTLTVARVNARARAVPMEGESELAQFSRHVAAVGPEVGRFIKRVRKNTGSKLRYLLVAEPHKSGVPHFHMLVHQTTLHELVRYDDLKSQWLLGFSSWKLCDHRSASYVCKYLSKSLRARVRASQAYGECPNALSLVRFPDVINKNDPPPFSEIGMGTMPIEGSELERNADEFRVSSPGLPPRKFASADGPRLSTETDPGTFIVGGENTFEFPGGRNAP